jgi:hypothetical protein
MASTSAAKKVSLSGVRNGDATSIAIILRAGRHLRRAAAAPSTA